MCRVCYLNSPLVPDSFAVERMQQTNPRSLYTSEEDRQIATIMLNYSAELGLQDVVVTSCRQRQRKYAVPVRCLAHEVAPVQACLPELYEGEEVRGWADV